MKNHYVIELTATQVRASATTNYWVSMLQFRERRDPQKRDIEASVPERGNECEGGEKAPPLGSTPKPCMEWASASSVAMNSDYKNHFL